MIEAAAVAVLLADADASLVVAIVSGIVAIVGAAFGLLSARRTARAAEKKDDKNFAIEIIKEQREELRLARQQRAEDRNEIDRLETEVGGLRIEVNTLRRRVRHLEQEQHGSTTDDG